MNFVILAVSFVFVYLAYWKGIQDGLKLKDGKVPKFNIVNPIKEVEKTVEDKIYDIELQQMDYYGKGELEKALSLENEKSKLRGD